MIITDASTAADFGKLHNLFLSYAFNVTEFVGVGFCFVFCLFHSLWYFIVQRGSTVQAVAAFIKYLCVACGMRQCIHKVLEEGGACYGKPQKVKLISVQWLS